MRHAYYILVIGTAILLPLAGCQETTQRKTTTDNLTEQDTIKQPDDNPATQQPEPNQIKITVKIMAVDSSEYPILNRIWRNINRIYLVARRPEIFDESRLKVGMAWAGFKQQLEKLRKELKTLRETETSVTIAHSKDVYIEIGQGIAIDKFFYYGRWYDANKYNFATTRRLLKITPRLIPEQDLINLYLTPTLANFGPNGSDMEFTEAAVNITLAPLQPAIISAPDEPVHFLASAFLSDRKNGTDTQYLIILTPRRL